MNRNLIRYSLLVLLIVTVGPGIQRTAAQSIQVPSRLILIEQHMPPVGLAFGQSLRINVHNSLTASSPEVRRSFKMLVAPLIMDLNGNVIAQGGEITLGPNESHFFDFKRDALPLAGEPGTGRLQVAIPLSANHRQPRWSWSTATAERLRSCFQQFNRSEKQTSH
jgi:hypothetical protein